MMRLLFAAGLALRVAEPAQTQNLRYDCSAKGKKGSGDAASVVNAKSESAAIEAMKARWPGYSSYVCTLAR